MSLYRLLHRRVPSFISTVRRQHFTSSTTAAARPRYPFPQHANPTPHEILGLPLDATALDIKKRYLELTKIYHPDTSTAQEMPEDVADTCFRAVAGAYNTLQQSKGRPSDSNDSSIDSEAEEIKNRLASWNASGSWQSPLEKARRQRALDAERNAGKWWKTDMTLYYVITGAAIAVGIMQFQGRSTSVQKERVRKYLEMRQKPEHPSTPQKEA